MFTFWGTKLNFQIEFITGNSGVNGIIVVPRVPANGAKNDTLQIAILINIFSKANRALNGALSEMIGSKEIPSQHWILHI